MTHTAAGEAGRIKKLDAPVAGWAEGTREFQFPYNLITHKNQHSALDAIQSWLAFCVHQLDKDYYTFEIGKYSFQMDSLLIWTPLYICFQTQHGQRGSFSCPIEIECIVNITAGTNRAKQNCWWWKLFAQQVWNTSLTFASVHSHKVSSLLEVSQSE